MLVPRCDICGMLCGVNLYHLKLIRAATERTNPVTKHKDGPRDEDVCRVCYIALVEFLEKLRQSSAVRSGVEVVLQPACVPTTIEPAPPQAPVVEPASVNEPEPVRMPDEAESVPANTHMEDYAFGLDEIGDL